MNFFLFDQLETSALGSFSFKSLSIRGFQDIFKFQEIQALIAPPQSDDSKKRQIGKDAMYSRSKRLLNRDSCDACKEGGDLLCCDQCPASFHLQCW